MGEPLFSRGITVQAYAKVNMALDVAGKRHDGYHTLRTVVQAIDLKDAVTMEDRGPADGDRCEIALTANWPEIPLDRRNSVWKALDALSGAYGLNRRLAVHIEKEIPVSSGLGGESTDAAAALRGAVRLYGLGATLRDLCRIGSAVGADVPFCISGGCALVEGIGDIVTPLRGFPDPLELLLVKPETAVISTAEVYRLFDMGSGYPRPDIDGLVKTVEGQGGNRLTEANSDFFLNSLEHVTGRVFPTIGRIKERLLELGAAAAFMTGHGPTVVGLFYPGAAVRDACGIFEDCWVRKASPVSCTLYPNRV